MERENLNRAGRIKPAPSKRSRTSSCPLNGPMTFASSQPRALQKSSAIVPTASPVREEAA
eukprot:9484118-Pyramimonas_sp.AAC.1